MTTIGAFGNLPAGLRNPLLSDFRKLVQNYMEGRWESAEMSGGKFCEVVYTIIDGFGAGSYAAKPTKPKDMVSARPTPSPRKTVYLSDDIVWR